MQIAERATHVCAPETLPPRPIAAIDSRCREVLETRRRPAWKILRRTTNWPTRAEARRLALSGALHSAFQTIPFASRFEIESVDRLTASERRNAPRWTVCRVIAGCAYSTSEPVEPVRIVVLTLPIVADVSIGDTGNDTTRAETR